jgi:uncharacterized protein
MLIEFSVGNYKSFRDVETFSMVATKIKAKDSEVDENNTFKIDDDLSLLKSAAIYGANASGKSNFATALRFMRKFVIESSRETQSVDSIPVEEFRLNSNNNGKPAFFEIVFLLDEKQYRYGFEVNSQEVISEWLFYVPTVKEFKLFERRNGKIISSQKFKAGKGLAKITRNNALFLSVTAQFNSSVSKRILQWFSQFNIISGLNDSTRDFTALCIQKDLYKDDILKFIKRLDLGINDIEIEETKLTKDSFPNMPEDLRKAILEHTVTDRFGVKTFHKKYNEEGKQIGLEVFDIDKHESEGTKKLFSLAGPLIDTLKRGKILFIDEFDARLNTLITREIVKLFNSNEANSKNAQIIFTTHYTNLLTNKLFRRDQIWFVEKDKTEATHLHSLAEYKVRNDASFENDYIQGRYGAIPFIGDLKQLFEAPTAVEETND